MVLLWWAVYFTMVSLALNFAGLLYFRYLPSSNRDDSFQKQASLPFCRANCAKTVCTCMCSFRFLSRNENNNGFGTVGLNSYLFDFKRVVKIRFTVVFLTVFPSYLVLDWMRNLHNEHHLAVKNGTFLAFLR